MVAKKIISPNEFEIEFDLRIGKRAKNLINNLIACLENAKIGKIVNGAISGSGMSSKSNPPASTAL